MSRKRARAAADRHWCATCRGGLVEGPDVVRDGRSFKTMMRCPNAKVEETQLPLPLDPQQLRSGERHDP